MSRVACGAVPVACVVVEVVDGRAPGPVDLHGVAVVLVVRGAPLAVADLLPGAVQLPVDLLGMRGDDPNLLVAAAGAGGCFPRDLLVVAAPGSALLASAAAVGARAAAVPDGDLASAIGEALAESAAADERRVASVGVGPHPEPWPDDDRLDPQLLRDGDRRNVVDRYRYWREEAIAADLAANHHDFHVAVENWQHDLNIGTVVRNANAFGAAGVHIVGERRWNRRGAMATDRYLPVRHHGSVDGFVAWARSTGLAIVGVDNVPGAADLDAMELPRRAVLAFGQEGPGLSGALLEACDLVVGIEQFGSTRSLNAGVASGIAMHRWVQCHAAWRRVGPRP